MQSNAKFAAAFRVIAACADLSVRGTILLTSVAGSVSNFLTAVGARRYINPKFLKPARYLEQTARSSGTMLIAIGSLVRVERTGESTNMSNQGPPIFASDGPIRILIVEDDVLIASEMEAVLQEAGAEVVAIAGSFDEALERCQVSHPTLALIDLELAGPEDGIELARQLSDRLGVRAIFVTGHSNPESVARGTSANPISWIKKPFGLGTIVAAVELARRELQGR